MGPFQLLGNSLKGPLLARPLLKGWVVFRNFYTIIAFCERVVLSSEEDLSEYLYVF